jgi:hypothetical protein
MAGHDYSDCVPPLSAGRPAGRRVKGGGVQTDSATRDAPTMVLRMTLETATAAGLPGKSGSRLPQSMPSHAILVSVVGAPTCRMNWVLMTGGRHAFDAASGEGWVGERASGERGAGSMPGRLLQFELHKRGKSCLMGPSMMNLPERRDTQPELSSTKTGLRPRPIQAREEVPLAKEVEGGGVLHFSCPACLRMISVPKGTEAAACPLCEAEVVPPRLATGRGGKTHLPIRAKSGRAGRG